MKTSQPIEPGLIDAFRFYAVFRIVILAIAYTIASALQLRFVDGILVGVSILAGLILIAYLYADHLCLRLKNFYLPVAFIYATFDAILMEKILALGIQGGRYTFTLLVEGTSATPIPMTLIDAEAWRVSPPLFVLLILISWQYRFYHTVIFALFTGIVDTVYPILTGPGTQVHIWYVLSGVLPRTVAFLLIGFIVNQLIQRQREQREQLQDANAKIANYAAMTERLTVSRERNRMARELHDTLAHTLSATSVQLEAISALIDTKPDKAKIVLDRALVITRDGLNETRRALQSLRAAPLEDLGLILALHELNETIKLRMGFKIDMTLPDEIMTVPVEVEQTIYRITQESIENALRHACAQTISVKMTQNNNTIQLEIVDDGIGFDIEQVDFTRHFGITGMMERVAAMGGKLNIQSKPDKGTRLLMEMQYT